MRIKVSEVRYRLPDVMVLSPDAPDEQLITHPPLAVFEVWSQDDTIRKMLRKLNDYERMGIPQIWLIDPADRIWQRFVNGRLQDEDTFSMPDRGINFPMNEISKLIK